MSITAAGRRWLWKRLGALPALLALMAMCLLPVNSQGAEPEKTVGLMLNTPGAYPGYTLFAPSSFTNTYLINNEGELIQRWTSFWRTGHSIHLLPDGHLIRAAMDRNTSFTGGGRGGRIEEYDWDGNLVWGFDYSDALKRQHHDILKLPNGNVLMIAWELKTAEEAIAAGRDPALITQGALWPDTLIEVEPFGTSGGTVVWEWHVWDHLIQDFDPTKDNYGVVEDHPELVNLNFARNGNADWLHFNGFDYNPELDQILVGTPFLNEIWIIDHSTTTAEAASHEGGRSGKGGDLLYRWGNPRAYGRGTVEDQKLFNQHNPQWIDAGLPGENRILVFNNGVGRADGNYSSVDEIIPPIDETGAYVLPEGGVYGPAETVWSYTGDPVESFYASFISGAQRLPNGHTLICDGPKGRFFEVTTNGVDQWLYVNPVRSTGVMTQGEVASLNNTFRATRYGLDYEGLVGRDLTPKGVIELIPGTPFEIIDVTASATDVVVRWNCLPDRLYQVEHRSALLPEEWSSIAMVETIGTEAFFTDTDPERVSRGKGYYRVMLMP